MTHRIWIDNVDGKFVRVAPIPGVWVDILPFRPVVTSIDLPNLCVLVFDEGDDSEAAIAAYEFDGTLVWTRRASELPFSERAPLYASTMKLPDGPERRLKLPQRVVRGRGLARAAVRNGADAETVTLS